MKLPIEVEFSRVPSFLEKFAPMNISAFSFGIWIFSKTSFTTRLRIHETIHFKQQLELAFVLQFLLYGLSFLINVIRFKGDFYKSYRLNWFEQEAFDNDIDPHYLENRKPYAWVKYIFHTSQEP